MALARNGKKNEKSLKKGRKNGSSYQLGKTVAASKWGNGSS